MSPEAAPSHHTYSGLAELLETFGNDEAFARELMLAFLGRCPVALEELKEEIARGDVRAISRTAHSLKGTLGYFDEGDGMAVTQRLEQLTQDDLPHACEMLRDLEKHLGDLNRFLVGELAS